MLKVQVPCPKCASSGIVDTDDLPTGSAKTCRTCGGYGYRELDGFEGRQEIDGIKFVYHKKHVIAYKDFLAAADQILGAIDKAKSQE